MRLIWMMKSGEVSGLKRRGKSHVILMGIVLLIITLVILVMIP